MLPGYDHWKTSPDSEDEEFPDATDDRDDFAPPEPPEPARYRAPSGCIVYEEDFMYDPLSRAGFE